MLVLLMLQVRLCPSIPKKYTMKTYFVDFVVELSRSMVSTGMSFIPVFVKIGFLVYKILEMRDTLYA
jgi:hypothetical protein